MNKDRFQLRPVTAAQRLIDLITVVAPDLKPRFQTAVTRALYWSFSAVRRKGDPAFLNYGYAPTNDDRTKLTLDPQDERDRFSVQLYARVAGARDLRGKHVVEVGCGQGGGASFIARYLHPASLTGVDLSGRAIRYCRKAHQMDGLTFSRGDAEHLPFPDNAFDAVINVESSHCYPSVERFLAEVERILRPDGEFLFADVRRREDVARLRKQIEQRFTIKEEEFITSNVVRALELDNDRRDLLIQKRAPKFLHNGLRFFLGVRGGQLFEAFSSGAVQYVRFVCTKRR